MNTDDKKLVYESIKDQLDQQISSVDSFTTRAGLVLATCGVVFAGYLQLLGSDSWMYSCVALLSVFEIFTVIISGLFAFLSLAPGGEVGHWRYDPNPEKLYGFMKDPKGLDVTDEMTKSMIEAYNHNRKLLDKKFDHLKLSRYFLYASGSIFIIHLLIFFF